VVTLGREVHVEEVEGTRFESWDTDEPSERGIEGMERMRLVRDDIPDKSLSCTSAWQRTRLSTTVAFMARRPVLRSGSVGRGLGVGVSSVTTRGRNQCLVGAAR